MGYPNFLLFELDVEDTAGSLPDVAFQWFEELGTVLCPEALEAFADASPARNTKLPGVPWFAVIEVTPQPDPELFDLKPIWRTASARGMAWLRTQLKDLPHSARVQLGPADPVTHRRLGSTANLLTAHTYEAPSWLRLGAIVPEARLLDPDSGAATQQTYLRAVRTFADRYNPGFGGCYYREESCDWETQWEIAVDPELVPLEVRWAYSNVNGCRQYLRGYQWLTILARELADRLGGADTVRATGAFAEVEELTNGGLWLLATHRYEDYDDAAVTRVFEALAPVMRPALPRDISRRSVPPPPQRLVLRDAYDFGAR